MDEDEVVVEAEDAEAKSAFGGSPDDSSEDESFRELKKVRDELKQCRTEKQEYMDGWQRAKADYVNLLKRIESDGKMLEQKGRIGAVAILLPAFDALERAREHGEVPEGFQAIIKQLESAFASLGLKPVGQVGEKFNPAVHEALGTDAADGVESDDTVTVVLEKGWRLGERIVRPAKVRVAHHG